MIEIRNWITNAVIHRDDEAETLGEAVVRAVSNGVSLYCANLESANLESANLESANLVGANLESANLVRANLVGANLESANLVRANLVGANLESANLVRANLVGANLESANLVDANLPSPTSVLLASWGEVSPQLCGDLMHYDASCHPDPLMFDRWASSDTFAADCPYGNVKVGRAAHFSERKQHWSLGVACRPYDLMTRVMAEKAPAWTEQQRADFMKQFEGRNGNNL